MEILNGKQLVEIWEAGQNRPLWFKAMLILSHALPGKEKKQLAEMSVGQRNYYLLKLRQLMFGSTIDSRINCPQCGTALEFKMNAGDIMNSLPRNHEEDETQTFSLTLDGVRLIFRPLNSRDLAALDQCRDTAGARRILLENCIIDIIDTLDNGEKKELKELADSITFSLGEKMASQYDPHVEIAFRMKCALCHLEWKTFFDIVSFLWSEIQAQARRVLHEVHLLARFYGWREADIFAMSNARKQFYLEMVS